MGVLSTLAFPVLLMLIPIFDTAFVTLSRKLSARKASVGGRDHTSHRLVALGFPESRAVLLLYGFAALGGATAVVLRRASFQEASLLTALLLIGLALLGVRLARVNVYGEEQFALLRDRPYTPLLVDFTYKRRVFEVLLDVLLASLGYYAAYVVRFGDKFPVYAGLFAQSLPTVIACELVGLYIAGAYRGIWRYICFPDLGTYMKGIGLGSVGSVLALVYLSRFEGYSRGVFIINGVFFAVLILGSRLSFRSLAEWNHHYRRTGRRALIYGAGEGGAMAVRELRTNPKLDIRVVGFIDDDASKQGRRVAGVPVLCAGRDLANVLGKTGAEVIILSTPIAEFRFRVLQSACFDAGVDLLQLYVRLEAPGSVFAAERSDIGPTVRT
jgi:UDP-GlcNAc:undecaprenyl-phosphate GlcNAc-1-phosphate transferase